MHKKPVLKDLKAIANGDYCIKINIDEDLSLEDSTLKILGPERTLLHSMTPRLHEFELCLYSGKPMFVELHTPLGTSVQYVKGSGNDFYNN
jgi:hypothetical protein